MRRIGATTLTSGIFLCLVSAAVSYMTVSQGSGNPADASGRDEGDAPPPTLSDWPPYPPGEGPGRGPAHVEPPGDDVTPEPGATPDTSQPWWYVPYLNAERDRPAFEGSINGIGIQTEPVDVGRYWTCSERQYLPLAAADDTLLGIPSSVLPEGAMLEGFVISVWCDGRPVVTEATLVIPSNEDAGYYGGSVQVFRYEAPALAAVTIPEDRWTEGEVHGYPAAFASPILDNGLVFSAIVVRHGNYVTRLVAESIPFRDVLAIAEGLVR